MSDMLMETYLRQQVDKGEYGVAIIQAQIALDIANYIEKHRQPTIEERKTDEWLEYDSDEDKYDIIKCPYCKHTFTVDSFHWTDIGFIKDNFNFCPNCGADMRGK